MDLQEARNEKGSLKERNDVLQRSSQEWEQKYTTMTHAMDKVTRTHHLANFILHDDFISANLPDRKFSQNK